MGSRKIAAAALAAMMLSGCAENKEESTPVSERSGMASSSSSVSQSSGVSQSTSNMLSSSAQSGGAPSVIAPDFTGSSSSSDEPVDVPLPPVQSVPEITSPGGNSHISIPDHYLVFEGSEITGDEFRVKSGEVYLVSDLLTLSSGCSLVIENGGGLYVSGTLKGDGDIIVSDGGKLTLVSDEAYLGGGGSLVVKGCFDDIDCTYGSVDIAVTPPERVDNGVTTVGGVVIANKAIKLPPEYGTWLSDGEVSDEAYSALLEMNSQSSHKYSIISAYRSYYSQKRIFNGWVDMYGFEYASTVSSQAGHSEHQTGLTMDLDSLDESYGDTPEGIWLAQNCYKYGFIIRYPKGKENITGYSYEPWHIRYLGKSTAKLVYSSGLTLEEFLNVEGGTEVID